MIISLAKAGLRLGLLWGASQASYHHTKQANLGRAHQGLAGWQHCALEVNPTAYVWMKPHA